MLYKTILLELIESRPELHARLKHQKAVQATVERLALDLKSRHAEWMDSLQQSNPDLDPIQLASQAGELALQEIEEQLEDETPETDETFSLDGAMAYLQRRSSNG